MNKDELARRNAAIKAAWTPEKRAAASAAMKAAPPRGARDPAWWNAHPEAKAKQAAQVREAWTAWQRARKEAGDGGAG